MKRKYYMRGLGIGIIATCLIFMIALLAMGFPMSDSAVKRRARQLGMVEASGDATENNDSRTLKEIQEEKDNSSASSSSSAQEGTTRTEVTTDPTGRTTTTTTTTKTHASGDKPDDGRQESDDARDKAESEKTNGAKDNAKSAKKTATPAGKTGSESVKVTIAGGDSSDDVGSKLEKAGVVSSGSDFNHYLEQNGYDRTIHTGTFSIKKGSSFSDIAKKIAG